jgi:hypothetical protein
MSKKYSYPPSGAEESKHIQDVLATYTKVLAYDHHVSHDGRTGTYDDSNIYYLFIYHRSTSGIDLVDWWHWEWWYSDSPEKERGFLKDGGRSLYTLTEFRDRYGDSAFSQKIIKKVDALQLSNVEP